MYSLLIHSALSTVTDIDHQVHLEDTSQYISAEQAIGALAMTENDHADVEQLLAILRQHGGV